MERDGVTQRTKNSAFGCNRDIELQGEQQGNSNEVQFHWQEI